MCVFSDCPHVLTTPFCTTGDHNYLRRVFQVGVSRQARLLRLYGARKRAKQLFKFNPKPEKKEPRSANHISNTTNKTAVSRTDEQFDELVHKVAASCLQVISEHVRQDECTDERGMCMYYICMCMYELPTHVHMSMLGREPKVMYSKYLQINQITIPMEAVPTACIYRHLIQIPIQMRVTRTTTVYVYVWAITPTASGTCQVTDMGSLFSDANLFNGD